MYVGNTPLDVVPLGQFANPVLTHDDITDVDAEFVADPFMIQKDSLWHMFFEVYSGHGDIGHAISEDGSSWAYQNIVIDEDFHMSYPEVFEWQGEYYMVPETHEANAIRLYKASNSSATPTFIAPSGLAGSEVLTFELVTRDAEFSSEADSVNITVQPGTQVIDKIAVQPSTQASTNNIAALAMVSASTENVSTSQLAIKAVDGVISGYPVDYSREWVTTGEKAGAWLKLNWSTAYVIDRVVLYDRPLLNNQITQATLSFSDGSSVSVGALDNAAGPTEITFPSRAVTWMRMTVNAVSATTSNVGLAEIEVFGSPAPLVNQPPSANAGLDQMVAEGSLVHLNGSGTDPNGDTLSYQWTQTAGTPVALSSNFLDKWSFIGNMLTGAYRDSTVFRYGDKWWLFTTEGAGLDSTLQLFYADELLGPWHAHPLSPVVLNDPNIARPGGRVTEFNGRLFRYTQDTFPLYGNKLRAFEITELSTTTYQEVDVAENPILDADGLGWNANGMHHMDPHLLPDGSWLAVTDGRGYPEQLDFYGLWLSDSIDRSNARLFDHDALVHDDQLCIYVLPVEAINRVTFYLDGILHQVDNYPPFDFAGSANDDSCYLYDIRNLTLAEHTISAAIELDDGSTVNVENTFQVFIDADADDDGVLNMTEITNGTDPNLADTDGDGLVDGAGGLVPLDAVHEYVDSDMDGFADGERDAGTNPLLRDSDGDGFDDGVEVADGSDPVDSSSFPIISDGDLSGDGIVNLADILIATRILLGELALSPVLLSHCDVAPLVGGLSSPDGNCNLGDLLVIQRTALGLR